MLLLFVMYDSDTKKSKPSVSISLTLSFSEFVEFSQDLSATVTSKLAFQTGIKPIQRHSLKFPEKNIDKKLTINSNHRKKTKPRILFFANVDCNSSSEAV